MDRQQSSTPPARPLVLLIHDHQDTLAVYALALSGMGFEVMPARNVDEAFARPWTDCPDVIVADAPHAVGPGRDVFTRVRAEPRTRDIPVVVLTDDGRRATEERARRAGAAALLIQPCPPYQVALALRRVIASSLAHVRASSRL